MVAGTRGAVREYMQWKEGWCYLLGLGDFLELLVGGRWDVVEEKERGRGQKVFRGTYKILVELIDIDEYLFGN